MLDILHRRCTFIGQANNALCYFPRLAADVNKLCAPCKLTISSYLFARWHLFRHVSYFISNKLTFDLLALQVVSESRVTWATSVPISVFLDLSVLELGPMYATDRQADVRQKHRLMPLPYGGGGIIKYKLFWSYCSSIFGCELWHLNNIASPTELRLIPIFDELYRRSQMYQIFTAILFTCIYLLSFLWFVIFVLV